MKLFCWNHNTKTNIKSDKKQDKKPLKCIL